MKKRFIPLMLAAAFCLPSNEEGAKPFAVSGARILFQSVTDESVVEELSKNAHPGAMFFEVTEVRPLG